MTTIADELRERTFNYALRITQCRRGLPNSWDVREGAGQLLRAGMGAVGHYWSACRGWSAREFIARLGRSAGEFIARLGIAEDEAAESVLWLMLIVRSGIRCDDEARDLMREGREITAILSASHKTARENRRRTKQKSATPNRS
jgi:four helix bundle protein